MILKWLENAVLKYSRVIFVINFVFILISVNCNVYAASYVHSIDQFEVTGNLPAYFVDDFDDGLLNRAWDLFKPTVTESGGVLTLSSPGDTYTVQTGDLTLSVEESAIESSVPGPTTVLDGAGDYTGVSTWLPYLPGMNQSFSMGVLHILAPYVTEHFSISVSTMDSSMAAAFGLPDAGTAITFGRAIGYGSMVPPVAELEFQAFYISSEDVTGNILLQLDFDDTNKQFTGTFSLDGGATFQNPFSPVSPSSGELSYIWVIDSASYTVTNGPVRIPGSPLSYFSSVQAAYDAAQDGESIQSRSIIFSEDLFIDDVSNKAVTFQGGFNDDFSLQDGNTTVRSLTLSHGALSLEHYDISPVVTIDVSSYANFNSRWDYKTTEGGVISTNATEVAGTAIKNGQNVYVLQEYDDIGLPNDQHYYLTDMSQGLMSAGGANYVPHAPYEVHFNNPAVPYLLRSFVPGHEYSYNYTRSDYAGLLTLTVKLEPDAVTVPAGTYTDCYKSTVTVSEGETVFIVDTRWYARSIGLVKRIQSDNGSIWELTQYTP